MEKKKEAERKENETGMGRGIRTKRAWNETEREINLNRKNGSRRGTERKRSDNGTRTDINSELEREVSGT